MSTTNSDLTAPALEKTPSGTSGLDDVLHGGFPTGRPSLVCGSAGAGKTLLGMQFLVRGALEHGEPGVFIAFEERLEDLRANVASLGFDLADLEHRGLLSIDHVRVDPTEIVENGEYDLSGLFLRLELAIDTVGAKRVVIDTLETLFGGLQNANIVRAEMKRLFDWLKEKGVTAIITAERGGDSLTRNGLEEYVSDCVLVLDHRVVNQISTRRLRVVKYRGSAHGTNEYPFLINEHGITVMPVTNAGLSHVASDERVSTGVDALDEMLGGDGVFRGSTVLLTGTAGSGKSSVAAHFADAACRRGERALYFSFEESPHQIIRNMRSIGLNLEQWIEAGLLRFAASRPTSHGIETHLSLIHRNVEDFEPTVVVLDPASNLLSAGNRQDAHALLLRLVDSLKSKGITAFLTTLTAGGEAIEGTNVEISSIVDTWLLLKMIELSGERNRGLYILKSRGMPHSNQIREFNLTDDGIELVDVYTGPEGVLTGSARTAQEARELAEKAERRDRIEQARRALERLERLHKERLATVEDQYESEAADLRVTIRSLEAEDARLESDRRVMTRARQGARASRSGDGSQQQR